MYVCTTYFPVLKRIMRLRTCPSVFTEYEVDVDNRSNQFISSGAAKFFSEKNYSILSKANVFYLKCVDIQMYYRN